MVAVLVDKLRGNGKGKEAAMQRRRSEKYTIYGLDIPSDLNLLMPDTDRVMPRLWPAC